MLDVHFVRENFELVQAKLATRNFDPASLADFTQLDTERRALIRAQRCEQSPQQRDWRADERGPPG